MLSFHSMIKLGTVLRHVEKLANWGKSLWESSVLSKEAYLKFAGMHFEKFSRNSWFETTLKTRRYLHISSHYSPIRINGRNDVLSRSNTASPCGKMYTRARNSQLYVKRDSSRRSLFVIQGNDVRTLKINDYNSMPAKLKFHHLPVKQPVTVHHFGANNCHASYQKIYNLNPNQSMYNCRAKVLLYLLSSHFFVSFFR